MSFATRTDLLARTDARRLAALATPADREMLTDTNALRVAISGGDLTGYSETEQTTIALMIAVIDSALADAAGLVISYGIPALTQTPLLSRIASTIAYCYLQSTEGQSAEVKSLYDAQIKLLENHAKGMSSLIPVAETTPPAPATDESVIFSNPTRYDNAACSFQHFETVGDW